MAKFGSYYGLCPLIDQKSLLGICEDAESGCVIVTLGRNMAIKYRLFDQKQLHSWSTREKLSSPVIYDKKGKRYVAVFNQYFIKVWTEAEQDLKKVKKLKFPQPIHTIVWCADEPIVLFKNGQTMSLSYALEVRKEFPESQVIESKDTVIQDQLCLKVGDTNYIGALLKTGKSYSFLWISPDCSNSIKQNSAIIIQLKRIGVSVKLNGHLAMILGTEPTLFTLWSDGRLYSYPLATTAQFVEPCGTYFSVIESLSRRHPVRFLPLNETYIAMYGADRNQEGASLQIYNTQFKVTQFIQPLKLYTDGSNLWQVDNVVLLTIGQHLAVVPYYLDTEQLAALVGSHKMVQTDDDIVIVNEMIHGTWDANTIKSITEELPKELKQTQITELINEGWSETEICNTIFPSFMAANDTKSIHHSLIYFTDIPENIIVQLLVFSLKQHPINSDIMDKGLPIQVTKLLDHVLATAHTDVLLLPQLRIGLKFEQALILLQYLCFLISDQGYNLPRLTITMTESKVIDWGCLIIDAHYQQLLLSKDTKILQNLEYFKALADAYMLCLDDYKDAEPVLDRFLKKKIHTRMFNTGSYRYSIEELKLY